MNPKSTLRRRRTVIGFPNLSLRDQGDGKNCAAAPVPRQRLGWAGAPQSPPDPGQSPPGLAASLATGGLPAKSRPLLPPGAPRCW